MSASGYLQDLRRFGEAFPHWSFLEGRSVAVIGATGLIGSYLVDLLAQRSADDPGGPEVYAVGRAQARLEQRLGHWSGVAPVHLVELDLNGRNRLPFSADFAIHLASTATPTAIRRDPVGTISSNCVGLLHALEASQLGGVQRFVFTSSAEVYGTPSTGGRLDEADYGYVDPLRVRSCYPSAKRAAESLCVAWTSQYGMPISIARPGYVFGPTFNDLDDRVVAEFIRAALSNQPVRMKSTGTFRRSYCYVGDCVLGLLTILARAHSGSAYNIASESCEVTIGEIAELVAAQAGVEVERHDDRSTAETGLSRDVVLSTRALRELGWAPVVSMAQGIELTYAIRRELQDNEPDSTPEERAR